MRRSRVHRFVLAALLAALTVPSASHAWGPGLHAREAAETARQLVDDDPTWAAVFDDPAAADALVLGAIAPDFRQVIDNLPFGHDRRLGYHLIDASAEGTAEQRAFALGFLAHVVSDNTADTFVAPGLWVMHALGPFDLVADDDESLISETELICETFGDLVLGEWHDVVDALFTYRFDGPEGEARLAGILGWYCAEANAFTGLGADCDAAVVELDALLARGDSLLGGVDRDGAHALLDALIDHPPADLVPVFSGGAISSLLGDAFTFSDRFPFEIDRFERSDLTETAFWDLYDTWWADLAPHLTIEQLARRANGWPRRDNDTLRGANWISTYRHLDPAWWGDGGGLVVESLAWTLDDHEGLRVPDGARDVGGSVTVRFFATRPITASVTATVRADATGIGAVRPDARGDAVADARVEVDLDPRRAVDEALTELVVPFALPTTEGVDGWFVEVAVDDAQPFFTGQTEPLYTERFATDIGVPLWQPVVRDAFRPDASWPGSLRVDRARTTTDLHVFARIGPDREGLAGATVQVGDRAEGTRDDGLALIAGIPAGTASVTVSAAGYDDASLEVELAGGRATLDAFLRPRLEPIVPSVVCDATCVPVQWAADRMGVDPERVFGVVEQDGTPLHESIYLGRGGDAELCPDVTLPVATELVLAARTLPVGGEPGPWDRSPPFVVDPGHPDCAIDTDAGGTDAGHVDAGADTDAGADVDVGAPDVTGDAPLDDDAEGGDGESDDASGPDSADVLDAHPDAVDEAGRSAGRDGGGCTTSPPIGAGPLGLLLLVAALTRRRPRA